MNFDTITNFPLSWPDGWARRGSRASGRFRRFKSEVTVADGVGRVWAALRTMGVGDSSFVVSTNVEPRLDGLPKSGRGEPADPGAAVYWRHGKQTRCMAIDMYDRVADNLAAIAATLDAMRAIKRHGGAEILDRAFIGFKALPMPTQWWQELGMEDDKATAEQIQDAHRKLAQKHHPDKGGDNGHMARINAARDRGLEFIKEKT